jgi:predicted O-methyltransferase YrrM
LNLGWDQADRDALHVLRPLLDAGGYLPWTDGALRPAALAAICNEIALAGRRELVELGSGVSTIVLARLARELGGRLTSLEHDPDWARVVRSQIERENLNDTARLIEAPLESHPLALNDAPWYAPKAAAKLPDEIDLLIVDGPPGYGGGMELSRYPALPALENRLALNAMAVLDDARREGERAILEQWELECEGWTFAVDETLGIARGVKQQPG